MKAKDFFIKEFVQKITIEGKVYDCMPSKRTKEQVYTQYGVNEGVSMFVKIDISDLPLDIDAYQNKHVLYRGKTYKIKLIEADSIFMLVKFGLVSLSS